MLLLIRQAYKETKTPTLQHLYPLPKPRILAERQGVEYNCYFSNDTERISESDMSNMVDPENEESQCNMIPWGTAQCLTQISYSGSTG